MEAKEINLKSRIKNGDIVMGPWCILPSPSLISIIAGTGMDFVIIDMEHGPHTFETVETMLCAAERCGCGTFVRVAKNDEGEILHALDLGADGVIVPHIQTKKDAEYAISSAKYHPLGERGFSPFTRAGGYSDHGVTNHCSIQNKRTMLCLIVEGKEGLENLDEILSVENAREKIDIIYIGAYDLSQALGRPGQVSHPDVKKRLEESINKIRAKGIAAGGYVAKNRDDIKWMTETGMQFITILPDCTIIYDAFEKQYNNFIAVKNAEYGGKQ